MRWIEEVAEGGLIPRGYGIYRRELHRCVTLVMPVPFNLLCRWVTTAYYWMVHGGWRTPMGNEWNQYYQQLAQQINSAQTGLQNIGSLGAYQGTAVTTESNLTFGYGIAYPVTPMPSPTPKHPALAWLDKRVDEIRVKL